MSGDIVALLVLIAGWAIAAGTLKLVANHCQRDIDAACARNDATKTGLDEALIEMRAVTDRTEAALAGNRRLIDLYAAVSGDPSSPEAVEARAAAAELARWN